MSRRARSLSRTLLALLLAAALAPAARAQSFGTEYVTFVRGDLRIFATRPNTLVELIDLDTGALAVGLGTNPTLLADAFDSWELSTGLNVRHLRVRASDASGGGADKPIVVWTGQLQPAIQHPASPPPTGPPDDLRFNPWMSYIPTIRDSSAGAGAEVGREFVGFTSRDLWIIARKGAPSSSIQIDDVITNVDFDADDTQLLTAASPELIYSDAEIDAWYLGDFEDDTIHVTCNVDCSLLAGFNGATARDWTATPPSYASGDEGSELGTLFYAYVESGLSVFPTQDDTTVTITDLTDFGVLGQDDSTMVFLPNGDAANPSYDFWTVVTSNLNAPTIVPRTGPPPAPVVTVHTNEPDAFEQDLVKVVADKPVLLYTGPIGSNVREFADVAFSVPTGTLERLTYAYAQNGGAEDLQVFAFDPATTVTITSLTTSILVAGSPIFHDFVIPVDEPWQGHPSIDDRHWQSGIWRGELLRIESDRPVTVINGDYDQRHFGAFIPFVRTVPLLPPIAVASAEPDPSCPGDTILLDGTASFDQDDEGVAPGIAACSWDADVSVDSDGNGVADDDVDFVGCSVSIDAGDCGTQTARLTVTDNEGETDSGETSWTVGDEDPPVTDCPAAVTVECGPDVEAAYAAWLAQFGCTDDCGVSSELAEDPVPDCGEAGPTTVTLDCTDDCGNAAACIRTFTVEDTTPPELAASPIEPCYPSLAEAESAALAGATATDVCDPAPALSVSSELAGCEATITVLATDACGNESSTPLTTRIDADPPVIAPPTPLLLECDGPAGIPVSDPRVQAWLAEASATDACGPVAVDDDLIDTLLPGCAPGTTRVVTFSSVDDCGNAASIESTITVVDTTPPELSVPTDLVLECNSPGGVPLDDPQVQAWLAAASASDVCGSAVVAHDAPPLLPSGCAPDGAVTLVSFTATDDCGLTTVLGSTITVVDSTPPEVLPGDDRLACLWPPNHRLVCFGTADFDELVGPRITDLCDSGPVTWRFAGCVSDQPDEARDPSDPGWNGDGRTEDDCVIAPDGSGICFRAERAGTGPGDNGQGDDEGASAQDGRHYSVLIVATDGCGNESEAVPVGHVFVPHDQSPAEDDCVSAAHEGLRRRDALPF